MADQNYQVNYTINVEASEGTKQLQAFSNAVGTLIKAKLPLTDATKNITDMVRGVDEVFRKNGRKKDYNYKFNIDTGQSEENLRKVKGLLEEIKTAMQGLKLDVKVPKAIESKTAQSNQKQKGNVDSLKSVEKVNQRLEDTQKKITKTIGKFNSGLLHLEKGRTINIDTDKAKQKLTELLSLLRKINVSTAFNVGALHQGIAGLSGLAIMGQPKAPFRYIAKTPVFDDEKTKKRFLEKQYASEIFESIRTKGHQDRLYAGLDQKILINQDKKDLIDVSEKLRNKGHHDRLYAELDQKMLLSQLKVEETAEIMGLQRKEKERQDAIQRVLDRDKANKKKLEDEQKAHDARQEKIRKDRKKREAAEEKKRAKEEKQYFSVRKQMHKAEIKSFQKKVSSVLGGYQKMVAAEQRLNDEMRRGAIGRLKTTKFPTLKNMPMAYMFNSYMLYGTMKSELAKAVDYGNIMESAHSILRVSDNDLTTFESRFDRMAKYVRQIGVETKFTAIEVAGAVKYLAMAGMDVQTINNSIRPIANLALISDSDISQIADLATNIMAGYNIDSQSMVAVADILASTTSRSNVNVMEMAESYKMSAGYMKIAGVEFAESAAAIGVLGDMGVKATMAGTSLRAMATRFAKPTKEAKETMERLNMKFTHRVNIFGKEVEQLRPLADIFAELKKKGATVEDMQTLFGKIAGNGAMMFLENYEKLAELTQKK